MPLKKLEQFEQYKAISLRAWRKGTKKEIGFLDEGRDVTTANGLSVIFVVREGKNTELKNLWVRPGGALHIGINEHLPLKGKTLLILKEILEGDVVKGTRYSSKCLSQKEIK